MLFVFHGTDVAKAGDKARSLIGSLRAKKPDAPFIHIGADDWSVATLQEYVGGQGLFSAKSIIFLDRVMEDDQSKESLLGLLPAIKGSENIFIVLEGKLDAESKRIFGKYADKSASFQNGTTTKDNSPKKVFALADALGERLAIRAWTIYRELVDGGAPSESLIGTLFWQVKCMSLANISKIADQAGLNSFVFSKSKRYLKNYSSLEIDRLMTDIIVLYHDGHLGIADMEIGLEKMLLELSDKKDQKIDLENIVS